MHLHFRRTLSNMTAPTGSGSRRKHPTPTQTHQLQHHHHSRLIPKCHAKASSELPSCSSEPPELPWQLDQAAESQHKLPSPAQPPGSSAHSQHAHPVYEASCPIPKAQPRTRTARSQNRTAWWTYLTTNTTKSQTDTWRMSSSSLRLCKIPARTLTLNIRYVLFGPEPLCVLIRMALLMF